MNLWMTAMVATLTLGAGGDLPQGGPPSAPEAGARLASRYQQLVSVDFENATFAEVAEWMRRQGVEFVAAPLFDTSRRRITLSVRHAPIQSVMDAVAEALGAHWIKQGSIHVLSGGHSFVPDGLGPHMLEGVGTGAPESAKALLESLSVQVPRLREFREIEGLKVDDMQKLERLKKLMPELKDLPEIRHLRELREIEGLKLDDMQKLERLKKLMPELKGLLREDLDKARSLRDRGSAEGAKQRTDTGIRPRGLAQLEASLTPAQRALHEKQGYLRLSDLTPDQRGLLPRPPLEGEWTISVVVGGKSLTIKGG